MIAADMLRATRRRAFVVLVATLVLLSIGSTTALAHDPAGETDDAIDLGSHDLRISDASIHVENLHVTGAGLPEKSVDDESVSVDGEFSTDGFSFTVNGQEVQVGHLHVVLDDVGLTIDDVSMGSGEA